MHLRVTHLCCISLLFANNAFAQNDPLAPVADEKTITSASGVSASVIDDEKGGLADSFNIEDIIEKPNEYHYASFGRPDPFYPVSYASQEDIEVTSLPEAGRIEETPLLSPLQKYSIGTLRVAGTWQLSSGEWKAMIMVPMGKGSAGIVAQVNDMIGNKSGKIMEINRTSLKVREFDLSPDGTREYSDTFLILGKQAEPVEKGKRGKKSKIEKEKPTLSSAAVGQEKNLSLNIEGLSARMEKAPEMVPTLAPPPAPEKTEQKAIMQTSDSQLPKVTIP